MNIVDKIIVHIEKLLGKTKYTDLVPEENNRKFYTEITNTSFKEYFLKTNLFWIETSNVFKFPQYYSEKIISSFIADKYNYQLFLNTFDDLHLSIIKYDKQFVLSYLQGNDKKIDFLKKFKNKTCIPAYYLKEKQLNQLLNKICIGSLEENIDILNNFFENTKSSLTKSNTKIIIKNFLVNKFNNSEIVVLFEKYWKIPNKQNTLFVKYNENQIKTLFVDKVTLMINYNISNSASKKDYERMLQEIANIFKKEFIYENIKVSVFDLNTYMITFISNEYTKEIPIEILWHPMLNQYKLLKKEKIEDYIEQLKLFLPIYLLQNKLSDELEIKQKSVIKKI